jgi:hypothetical protein
MTRPTFIAVALALAAAGCHDPNRYLPAGPDSPDGTLSSPIVELTATPAVIQATGGAHATIAARIDPRSSVKSMNFTTTRGVLSAHGESTSATKTAIDVPVSDSGIVTVDLQSGAQPGPATVTATISLTGTNARSFTRTVDVMFAAVSSGDVITLSASPSAAEADGDSRIFFTASVSPEVSIANSEVVFTASGGDFVSHKDSGSVTPQARVPLSGGVAIAQLQSPTQPGNVIVTAQVGTFRATASVSFGRATPDVVFVQPAKSAVAKLADTVVITTYLVRNVGQVAPNTVVTYEARDSAGTVIGTLFAPTLAVPDPEDTSRFPRLKSTATFDPDNAAALGAATITVRAGGKTASTAVEIQ